MLTGETINYASLVHGNVEHECDDDRLFLASLRNRCYDELLSLSLEYYSASVEFTWRRIAIIREIKRRNYLTISK
jgi:hypothetical protein